MTTPGCLFVEDWLSSVLLFVNEVEFSTINVISVPEGFSSVLS